MASTPVPTKSGKRSKVTLDHDEVQTLVAGLAALSLSNESPIMATRAIRLLSDFRAVSTASPRVSVTFTS